MLLPVYQIVPNSIIMAPINQGECKIAFKLALNGQAGESGDSNEIILEAHVAETSDKTFDFDPSANAPLTDKFICLSLRHGKFLILS